MMNMMGLANKRLGQYPFNIFIIYDQYFYKWPIIYICMKLIAKGPAISLSKSASSYVLDGVRRSVENHYFVYD